MSDSSAKTIVITGVTRGIGRALAAEFIRLGHTVLGCGRSLAAVEELRAGHAEPHDFYQLDVTDADGVKSWASLLLTRHGAPDLLINNAAIINKCASLWEVEAGEFDAVIDVNIKGVANVVRSFVPAMIRRRAGVIVNLSSGWGRSTDAEVAPYCATKWAIEGLTKALAQELPSTLAAVPLSPGCVDTDML
ncbi:MAG: SDR family oxidoreductase, partial [Pirellulales bacterium]|nr:SDR family oxidoreductase [Pirellulales bacterium]